MKQIKFIIKTTTGRDLSSVSSQITEDEVLIMPFTYFYIERQYPAGSSGVHIF
jgi:hypothetical protein